MVIVIYLRLKFNEKNSRHGQKSHLYSSYNVNKIYPYITKHEIFSYTISLRSVYTKRGVFCCLPGNVAHCS